MPSFYLTTAIAVIITTSLASNLLWVMAFGTAASGFPGGPLSQLRAGTAAEAKPR